MDLELKCPHCNDIVIINIKDINCGIFRHAVYIKNMNPINPHESKENCDKLVKDGLVYGCAKPFRIINIGNEYLVEICDYI